VFLTPKAYRNRQSPEKHTIMVASKGLFIGFPPYPLSEVDWCEALNLDFSTTIKSDFSG
jgi:hypothetical protein